jgi:hypothetical protein
MLGFAYVTVFFRKVFGVSSHFLMIMKWWGELPPIERSGLY